MIKSVLYSTTKLPCATFKRYFCLHSRLSTVNVENFDLGYLCNPSNLPVILNNINKRKGVGDIVLVQNLKSQLDNCSVKNEDYDNVLSKLIEELRKLPNLTHPDILTYGEEPKSIKTVGSKRDFSFKPLSFDQISKRLKLVRTDQLGNLSGSRSYFLLGEMAELENALINYTLHKLSTCGFKLISVPDLLPRDTIESCGMNTRGIRNQVYSLQSDTDICLSGTSEMALGGYFCNKIIQKDDLPIKFAAVSRCYRAEASSTSEERGLYRVHEFTKVEMFAVTSEDHSENLLMELRTIEEDIFSTLGLHFQVLDMPAHELGSPAYRKYDIEAWLPGRNMYGEISSCSNCTDYQARRLNIKYVCSDGHKFVHTLNGTACAIPRMLIALVETYQNDNGTISLPEVLWKYMREKQVIGKQKQIPDLKLIKHKKS